MTNIEAQPVAIVDMGCGDGALLRRLFNTIKQKTMRGRLLHTYPLLLVGVDVNKAALMATEEKSIGYPIIVLEGDIGNPSTLNSELLSQGIDPAKVLHVRSFLDHDRPYSSSDFLDKEYQSQVCREWWGPRKGDDEGCGRELQSSFRKMGDKSLFIDEAGFPIPFPLMYSNLVNHLQKWKNAVSSQYGLIILEVHSLPPPIVEKYLEQTESLHFDLLQILSRQCLVEAATFHQAMAEVGLFPSTQRSLAGGFSFPLKKYPKSLPFCRITLGHYFPRSYRIRCAEERDLNALSRLEKKCWPEPLRISKEYLKRRIERYPTGQFVLEVPSKKSEDIVEEDTPQVIGVIFTRRLASADLMEKHTSYTLESLHDSEGPILQLIELNVDPTEQHHGFGQTLLHFVLTIAQLTPGIERILGVTRCRDFGKYCANEGITPSEAALGKYVKKNVNDFNEGHHVGLDATLRFHGMNGARILEVVSGYRPLDFECCAAGVLIEYDYSSSGWGISPTDHLSMLDPELEGQTPERVAEEMVKTAMMKVIGDGRLGVEGFTDKIMNTPWMSLGLDSLDITEIRINLYEGVLSILGPSLLKQEDISGKVRNLLSPEFMFEHATPREAVTFLVPLLGFSNSKEEEDKEVQEEKLGIQEVITSSLPLVVKKNIDRGGEEPLIEVVGISCRFPGGVEDSDSFWNFIQEKKNSFSSDLTQRWKLCNPNDHDEMEEHSGALYGSLLDNIEAFDAPFFNISPTQARLLDPHVRHTLEKVVHAFEDAEVPLDELSGTQTGIFIGQWQGDSYGISSPSTTKTCDNPYYGTGRNSSTTAGAVSMFLDTHGPALTVNTACSSSLVALHLAIQSLQKRESSPYAIVVGVNILLDREMHQHLASVGILNSQGKCQPFRSLIGEFVDSKNRDDEGTVRGDGICVLVLSLERDPQQQNLLGHLPHALIETTGVNCDGRSTLLTAPNPLAQKILFRDCLSRSMSVEKESHNILEQEQEYPYVQAIEMHGTGTQLGDPIELRSALSVYGSPSFPIHIGSVKSNFGHTESTAGLAGVLKMIMSLQRRAFLPMSYTQRDYEDCVSDLPSFSSSPSTGLFVISKEVEPWVSEKGVRRGAVSSFGWTGTNAHCILREAAVPDEKKGGNGRMCLEGLGFVLVLSSMSLGSLQELKRKYLKIIKQNLKSPKSSSHSSRLHPLQSLCIRSALFKSHARMKYRYALVWNGLTEQQHIISSLLDPLKQQHDTPTISTSQVSLPGSLSFTISKKISTLLFKKREVAAAELSIKFNKKGIFPQRLESLLQNSVDTMVEEGLLSSEKEQWGGAKVTNDEEERWFLLALCHAVGEFMLAVMQPTRTREEPTTNKMDPLIDVMWEIDRTHGSDPLFAQYAINVVRTLNGICTWQESCSLMKSHSRMELSPMSSPARFSPSPSSQSIDLLDEIIFSESPHLVLLNIFSSIFSAGFQINWSQYFPASTSFSLSTDSLSYPPLYPFDHSEVYWMTDVKGGVGEEGEFLMKENRERDVLLTHLMEHTTKDEYVINGKMSDSFPSFIQQHVIEGVPVVAGATLVSCIWDMLVHIFPPFFSKENLNLTSAWLTDISFLQPLCVLEEQTLTIQCKITRYPSSSEQWSLVLQSCDEGKPGNWVENTRAVINLGTEEQLHCEEDIFANRLPVAERWKRESHPLIFSSLEWREKSKSLSLLLGDSFHFVENVYELNEKESYVGILRAPTQEEVERQQMGLSVIPGMLDGCVQVAVSVATHVIFTGEGDQNRLGLFVPVGINEVIFYSGLRNGGYVNYVGVLLRHIDSFPSFVFDLNLYDEKGILVGEMRGLVLRKMKTERLINFIESSQSTAAAAKVWVPHWERFHHPPVKDRVRDQEGRGLVIFSAKETLSSHFSEKGWDRLGRISFDVEDKELLIRRFVSDLKGWKESGVDGIVVDVVLSDEKEGSCYDVPATQALVSFLKLIVSENISFKSGILLCVEERTKEKSFCVDGASLYGVARSVQIECPSLLLGVALVSVDRFFKPMNMTFLHQLFGVPSVFRLVSLSEDQIQAHVLNLRGSQPLKENSLGVSFGGKSSLHIVTGGLGVIGLVLAKKLAEQPDTGCVLLLQRTVPSEKIDELSLIEAKYNMRFVIIQCDVSNAESLQSAILSILQKSDLELKGIWHTAGVLEDATLFSVDWASQWKTVSSGKVAGALNLHHFLEQHSSIASTLRHFVCFSSCTSLLGAAGQLTYTAANACLDSLMAYRSDRGLPGFSINLGPVQGPGMFEKNLLSRWKRLGWGALDAAVVVDQILGLLRNQQATSSFQAMIGQFDVKQHLISCPMNLFLFPVAKQQTTESSGEFSVKTFEAEEQISWEEIIVEAVARLCGVSSNLDVDQSLFEQGMDSLIAVELRNELQNRMCAIRGNSIHLSNTLLFDPHDRFFSDKASLLY